MNSKRNWLLFCVGMLLLLIGVLIGITYRSVRQQMLKRDLIAAIKRDDTRAAMDALRAGADPNTQGYSPQTLSFWQTLLRVLHAQSTSYSVSPTPLLLIYNETDHTPFQPFEENVTLVKALLDKGANPNAKNIYGRSVLLLAVMSGHTKTANLLLQHGAEVNAQDNSGETALIWAALIPDIQTVRALLKRHARVNQKDSDGRTALSYAQKNSDTDESKEIIHERKEIIRLLKQAGAK